MKMTGFGVKKGLKVPKESTSKKKEDTMKRFYV
jgi:hypothetical protein